MKIEVIIMNAFGINKSGGNPAGIVYNKNELSNEEKQLIAKKVGLSETVFINGNSNNEFEVSFFTPNKEVDLCGHGTIAAFQLLLNNKVIFEGKYLQITRAGNLEIIIDSQNKVFMEQKLPEYLNVINDRMVIANSLNINESDLIKKSPVQIISTGLKDIMIGVKNNKILDNIRPNFNMISKISEEYQVVGYHVFSLEKEENETANCRNFAPFYGINEECATGTSSGALACYLFNNKIINKNKCDKINFLQGKAMKKLSNINVSLVIRSEKVMKVLVGGNAAYVESIYVEI
jgi:PhzF family phenazine biosynthesis protein